ncbi:MAG: SDR family oxidoreductase [Bdellovibrionota bacterium]
MMQSRVLEGKVAIITGGGRGIGAATAKLFASEGARVVVASRTSSEIDEVVQHIGLPSVIAMPTDVSDESQVHRLFEEAEHIFGPVNILVNNAAIAPTKEFIYLDASEWDQVMNVNLRGSFLCAREAFRRMSKKKGGAIVNISSLGGIKGTQKFKGFCAYSVSKSAIVGLTECLAVEGREYGIRVNCVAPGAVDTKMLKTAAPFLKTETLPIDIAKAILLFSDDHQSKAVSGAVLEIHSNL